MTTDEAKRSDQSNKEGLGIAIILTHNQDGSLEDEKKYYGGNRGRKRYQVKARYVLPAGKVGDCGVSEKGSPVLAGR